ncbi:MAG: hypothetical protein KGV51_06715 [Moraxellaceae bacterium]|nr:hypothetical protein [Moraxellaceae bacterium]
MGQNLELQLVINADGTATVRTLREIDDNLDDLNDTSARTERGVSSTFKSLASKVAMFGSALAGVGTALGLNSLVETQREFDILNSQLITATGGTKQASEAFAELTKFASTTPYALEQSVQGFTQLKNLGLDPSMRSMRSYGNFAAAMGKDLSQMIEAVADASTFEFERLKEFGIKSSQQGDKVKFTFQGVETTVAKNSKAIQEYLLAIGENKFGDAMANRAKTLDGAMSNLEDNFNSLKLTIVQSGIGEAIQGIVINMSDGLARMTEAIKEPENAEKFKSAINGIGTAFDYLKTGISSAMAVISSVSDFFMRNKEVSLALASAIGAMALSFGGLTAGLAIITKFKTAVSSINLLIVAFRGVGLAMSAISFMTSPITLVAVAIGALVAVGVALYRNWDTVKAKAQEVFAGLPAPVQTAVNNIKSIFTGLKNVFNTLKPVVKKAFNFIAPLFKVQFQLALNNVKTVFNAIKGTISTAFRAIKAVVTTGITVIATVFNTTFNLVKNTVKTAFNAIKALARGDIRGFVNIMRSGLHNAVGIVKTGVSGIARAFGGLTKKLFSIGKDAVQGLINGIKGKISGAVATAKSLASSVASTVKNFFVIRSPSRLMAEYGGNISEGLAKGIKQKESKAVKQARRMSKKVAREIARTQRSIALKGKSKLFKFDYDVKHGKYKGASKSQLAKLRAVIAEKERMSRVNKRLSKQNKLLSAQRKKAMQQRQKMANKIANEINSIKKFIALFGNKSELARFDYDVKNGEYKGATKSELSALRKQIALKEQLIKTDEERKKQAERIKQANNSVASSIVNLNKQIALFDNKDPLKALQYDIDIGKFDGADSAKIQEMLKQTQALEDLKQAKSITDFTANQQATLDNYAFETSLIGKQKEEVEKLRFEHKLMQDIKRLGKGFSDKNKQALQTETNQIIAQREELIKLRKQQQELQNKDWVGGMKAGLESIANSAKSLNETMKNATTSAFNKMSDGIATFVATGKGNFKDLARSIIQDISKMLIKFSMLKLAKMALGSFGGGGLFGGLFANGGAFNSQGVQYYAKGDIFDKPTAFRHAGGIGVMGEAGAEAIMPLTRGSDGKLGVKVYGNKKTTANSQVVNQVQIDIHVNNDGANADVQTSTQDSKRLADNLRAVVLQVLQDESRAGGMLASR